MAENKNHDVVEPNAVADMPHTAAAESTSTNAENTPAIVKKNGTLLGLLAILIALGLGAAGYYFGQQQVDEIHQKTTALEQQIARVSSKETSSLPNFAKEQAQLTALETQVNTAQEKLARLEQSLVVKDQLITGLQTQIEQIRAQTNAQQPTDWLFSEADFLLNNALRKLVLDNDVDTAVSLLKLADETLAKVGNSQSMEIRQAINQDLKQLLSVPAIDQNAVMQNLSALANNIDELPILNVNFDELANTDKLSDSLDDWKTNAEKSAISFLNHFIRISPKQNSNKKELLAPNQDIYLRENIRLRLQLAIMAVPRQQNDLYKESLEAVAAWIRSYFDTDAEVTQAFLKSLDNLAALSIYVDVPSQLQSLTALDKLLSRMPQEVRKIEIETDKALSEMPKAETPSVQGEASPSVPQANVKPEQPLNDNTSAEAPPAALPQP